jgi:molybdopterin molybdotransferase
MISVEEARQILEANTPVGSTGRLPLTQANGLILAEDVFAGISVPPFDNSAMDGYAMDFAAGQSQWTIRGEIPAGDNYTQPVKAGEAIRIFTGSPMPAGTDTVIPQEDVGVEGDRLTYTKSGIQKGANVRTKGSQIREGQLLMKAGSTLTPGAIGLLASTGKSMVQTYAPPRVGIIVTGNELTTPGEALMPGKIYNSNAPMLEASLQQLRVSSVSTAQVSDHYASTRQMIADFIHQHDLVIISGGISVGDYDFVKRALDSLDAQTLIYKIKQRPGKPFYAGICKNKTIFALPGNPASVLSCFNHFVKPVIKKMMGVQQVWQPDNMATLTTDVEKKKGFTFFLKGKYHNGQVEVLQGQQSFNLIAFSEANCFIELPEDVDRIPAGTQVATHFLYP